MSKQKRNIKSFCHSYKTNTNSAKRTKYMATQLNTKTEYWFHDVKQQSSYKNVKLIKINETSQSDNFNFQEKKLYFSGKIRSDIENEDLKNLPNNNDSYRIESILGNDDIEIIDTTNGCLCFENGSLLFLLLPRKESVTMIKRPKAINREMVALSKIETVGADPRGKNKHVVYENEVKNYVTLGLTKCMNSVGLYQKQAKNGKKLSDCSELTKLGNYLKNLGTKWIPRVVLQEMNKSLNSMEVRSFDDYGTLGEEADKRDRGHKETNLNKDANMHNGNRDSFVPSIAFGENTALNMHTDQDGFLSVITLHCNKDIERKNYQYRYNASICKYFVFENKMAVGLRSGDVLIFNPCFGHCISTLTSSYKTCSVICVSHYFKATNISMNDNGKEFNVKE